MLPRILLVDGDELVRDAASCMLETSFHIDTAADAETALRMIVDRGSYAAVVSDLDLPDMYGATFLYRVKQLSPISARLILAGDVDFTSLVDAVNTGSVFKLLRKPCPVEVVCEALYDAVVQYGIKRAESQRLDEAMNGTICALQEALAVINPPAFHQTQRIVNRALAVGERLGFKNLREIEWAASLSHLGCIAVPERVIGLLLEGAERLSVADIDLYSAHPSVTAKLLARSPQLQSLATIIKLQHDRLGFDSDDKTVTTDDAKCVAHILRVATDYELQTYQGILPQIALARLTKQRDHYDPKVVAALADLLQCSEPEQSISLHIRDMCVGMTLEQGAVTTDGRPLMKAGTELTEQLLGRLRIFANNVGVLEPILVSAPAGSRPSMSHGMNRPHLSDTCLSTT